MTHNRQGVWITIQDFLSQMKFYNLWGPVYLQLSLWKVPLKISLLMYSQSVSPQMYLLSMFLQTSLRKMSIRSFYGCLYKYTYWSNSSTVISIEFTSIASPQRCLYSCVSTMISTNVSTGWGFTSSSRMHLYGYVSTTISTHASKEWVSTTSPQGISTVLSIQAKPESPTLTFPLSMSLPISLLQFY